VAEVVAGGLIDCLRTTSGVAQCWGAGELLGDGELKDSAEPRDVVGLEKGVQALGVGLFHACASTRSAECWGDNRFGQLGDGTVSGDDEPIHSEPGHVCAIGATPPCAPTWGNVLAGVTALDGGNRQTCAITGLSGLLACWGANDYGQLGDGGRCGLVCPVPVLVCADASCKKPLSGVIAIAVGSVHTCALTTERIVYCWGLNNTGQVGTYTGETCHGGVRKVSCSRTPLPVEGVKDVVAIAAGGGFSCAVTKHHDAWCWGDNTFGQLGVDLAIDSCPTDFFGSPIVAPCSRIPVKVQGMKSKVTSIAAGGSHACATARTGHPVCWGLNDQGQVGAKTKQRCPFLFGSTPCSATPLEVPELVTNDVSAGSSHTCAVVEAGGHACWGQAIMSYSAWNALVAAFAAMFEPVPTPTPTPTVTVTATPAATATATPEATVTPLPAEATGDAVRK